MSVPSGSLYSAETVQAFFQATFTPQPVLEFKFNDARRWRFDLAWPDHKLALEVIGGIHNGGRHLTADGYTRDMEKENAAAAAGWRILKVTPTGLLSFGTAALVQKALGLRPD